MQRVTSTDAKQDSSHGDVKTAFLNEIIEHDIFMSQLEGFIDPDHPKYVCKLKKSLYGLKQSARCWNQTLDNFLIANGYRRNGEDNCIYVKSEKKEARHRCQIHYRGRICNLKSSNTRSNLPTTTFS